MKFIITPVLWCIAVASGVLSFVFLIDGGAVFIEACDTTPIEPFDWRQAVIGIVTIGIGLFLISTCAFTIGTAREIDKEKDRNYVASMFANIVATVALILSLIALVKGVG